MVSSAHLLRRPTFKRVPALTVPPTSTPSSGAHLVAMSSQPPPESANLTLAEIMAQLSENLPESEHAAIQSQLSAYQPGAPNAFPHPSAPVTAFSQQQQQQNRPAGNTANGESFFCLLPVVGRGGIYPRGRRGGLQKESASSQGDEFVSVPRPIYGEARGQSAEYPSLAGPRQVDGIALG